jgi:hypothetical protein
MDIQGHERTAQIKKLSGYLYTALRWLSILLWLLWPLVVLHLLFLPAQFGQGKVSIPGLEVQLSLSEPLAMFVRVVATIWLCICIAVLQRLVHQLRELMAHFRQGAMFSSEAIQAARGALKAGIAVFLLGQVTQAIGAIASLGGAKPSITIALDTLLTGAMVFGVMYVLLWTLEVGHAMQQESELTV